MSKQHYQPPQNKTTRVEVSDNLPEHTLNVGDEGLELEGIVNTVAPHKEFDAEVFANELVVINLAESTDENANQLPWVTVGEQRQFLPRGVNIAVKRKFVEVLARCKETKYKQTRPDPVNPDYQVMQPKTALAYPFSVIEDKNPKGREWLRAIMHEAA